SLRPEAWARRSAGRSTHRRGCCRRRRRPRWACRPSPPGAAPPGRKRPRRRRAKAHPGPLYEEAQDEAWTSPPEAFAWHATCQALRQRERERLVRERQGRRRLALGRRAPAREGGEAIEEHVERDAGLGPRERRAQAGMDAGPERDVLGPRARGAE